MGVSVWILALLFTRHPISGQSFNQPKFSSCAQWNTNATTFADQTSIGSQPAGLFITDRNRIYATVPDTGRILIWSNASSRVNGTISADLILPFSIFVTDNEDIYVDNGVLYGRVEKRRFNTTMIEPVMLVNKSCTGLFVDVRNYLYCSSAEEHQVFATELNRVAGTGCPGPVSNMLDHPHGIFVTTKFSLYVSDTHNNRIQRFDPGQTSAFTVAGSGARVYFILNRPTGVVLDADENLFIVDSGNHRILRFVSDTFQCLFGCSGNRGSSASDLNQPRTMAFDREGHIFVTDARNNRIQTFRLIQNSCVAPFLYGVQLNFALSTLSNAWSQCYMGTYAIALTSNVLRSVLSACNKSKLLLGCRSVGSSSLIVAAMGLRSDVLYNCGSIPNCSNVANGVGWYYSDSYSWGFVNGSDTLDRDSCDTLSTNPDYRLCWYTGQNNGGYRCGSFVRLNLAVTYERVIYHAN